MKEEKKIQNVIEEFSEEEKCPNLVKNKRFKNQKGKQSKKKPKNEESEGYGPPIVKENKKLEFYYNSIFLQMFHSEAEKNNFWDCMRSKLPIVFRINPTYQDFNEISKRLGDIEFILNNANKSSLLQSSQKKEDALKLIKPEDIQQAKNDFKVKFWNLYQYPLVYQIAMSRMDLKKSPIFAPFHKYLQLCSDTGLVSRQELVSMIPPIVLKVEPHHKVIDMCAAPGSKTGQILEYLNGFGPNINRPINTGFVIANEIDYKRSFLLAHQLKRYNSSSVLVVNMNATNFPSFFESSITKNGTNYDSRILFDRVLCDVPCSGDGAIRKLPMKWVNWSTRDAISLHPLQLKILKRGLELLKPGGRLVYSTCSLNPIEDEAVISTAIKDQLDLYEIEEIEPSLGGIKIRRGVSSWDVLYDAKGEDNIPIKMAFYSDFPEEQKKFIKESIFPLPENIMTNSIHIERCVKILPHDNDSGGFFITSIKKKISTEEEEKKIELSKEDNKIIKVGHYIQVNLDDPEIVNLKKFYGLDDEIIKRLYIQDKVFHTIFFISVGLQEYLKSASMTPKNELKVINVGVECFEKPKGKNHEFAPYRITSSGVKYIGPVMTKRKYKIENFELLTQLIAKDNLVINDIKEESLQKSINEEASGSLVLEFAFPYCGNKITEYVIVQKTFSQLLLYAPKEIKLAMKLRFNILN